MWISRKQYDNLAGQIGDLRTELKLLESQVRQNKSSCDWIARLHGGVWKEVNNRWQIVIPPEKPDSENIVTVHPTNDKSRPPSKE